ncbi:hypothetical protein DFH09DRAFT_1355884 [Mycena vulgaris]|nr:hypothetical protein DFH09DRAFT_1355884 [Mycena vulgaris]
MDWPVLLRTHQEQLLTFELELRLVHQQPIVHPRKVFGSLQAARGEIPLVVRNPRTRT